MSYVFNVWWQSARDSAFSEGPSFGKLRLKEIIEVKLKISDINSSVARSSFFFFLLTSYLLENTQQPLYNEYWQSVHYKLATIWLLLNF